MPPTDSICSSVQLHRRHQCARLKVIRILNPGMKILRRIQRRTGRNRCPARQVRQVRPKRPLRRQCPQSCGNSRTPRSRNMCRPAATLASCDSPAAARSVTHAANCSGESTYTRSSIFACSTPQNCAHCPTYTPVWCGSSHISFGWLGIRSVLPAKLRHPEAVIHVGRQQVQKCRLRIAHGRAHRHVQFVGRHDAQLGIAELPPELVSRPPSHPARPAGFGASWIAKMIRAVVRNRTTTMSTGITVHASSTCVLP
jgi:hypothetical protein